MAGSDSFKKTGMADNQKIMDQLSAMNDDKVISAQRLFTGKRYDDKVGLFTKDEQGNERINIYINKNNHPNFEILDKDGMVVKELTE